MSEPPVDTATGFYEGREFLRYIAEHDKSKTRWDNLETGAFAFWYRGSPRPLAAHSVAFSGAPIFGSVVDDRPADEYLRDDVARLTPLGNLRTDRSSSANREAVSPAAPPTGLRFSRLRGSILRSGRNTTDLDVSCR